MYVSGQSSNSKKKQHVFRGNEVSHSNQCRANIEIWEATLFRNSENLNCSWFFIMWNIHKLNIHSAYYVKNTKKHRKLTKMFIPLWARRL